MRKFRNIYDERYTQFLKYYPQVEKIYETPYSMPELDPLRHEIALCIMFGFHQAAITLTNHLIEWFVKLMLIYKDSTKKSKTKDVSKKIVENIEGLFKEGIDNYIDKDMSQTISKAKSIGIFTKDQWKRLNEIRENYRNAFGHADSRKIFGDSEIKLTGMSTEEDKLRLEEPVSTKIAEMPIIQGLLKYKFAEAHSVEYFTYIDNLIRDTLPKVFPSSEDIFNNK
ncbi:TPA: hypothetical protein ENS27_13315 [bacterium]|nr:hypothetical protein [bacterium]